MARINYEREDIRGILCYVLTAILLDVLVVGFESVRKDKSDIFETLDELLGYLRMSESRIAPIILEVAEGLNRCTAGIGSLDNITNTRTDATLGEKQSDQAVKLYLSLIRTPAMEAEAGLLKLYLHLDTLPYMLYLLSRIVIYGSLDLAEAFDDDIEKYDLIDDYRDFLKMNRIEVHFLYELSTKIWDGCDELTLLIVQ